MQITQENAKETAGHRLKRKIEFNYQGHTLFLSASPFILRILQRAANFKSNYCQHFFQLAHHSKQLFDIVSTLKGAATDCTNGIKSTWLLETQVQPAY